MNKGIAAEYLFDAECIKRGIRVCRPICDMAYDRIIDVDGRMIRVQIKCTDTKRRRGDAYRVNFSRGGKPYGSDIDFFAIYMDDNFWAFIPVGLAPASSSAISIEGKFKTFINNWEVLK